MGDRSFPSWKPSGRGAPGFQAHLGQVLSPQGLGTATRAPFHSTGPSKSLFQSTYGCDTNLFWKDLHKYGQLHNP